MSIQDRSEKDNSETYSYDGEGKIEKNGSIKALFWPLVLVLVGALAFGLGRLFSTKDRPEMRIYMDQDLESLVASTTPPSTHSTNAPVIKERAGSAQNNDNTAAVFGSSKGKRYYYPGCKNTISEKNKITFPNKEMAEQAGYTLAANCHQ